MDAFNGVPATGIAPAIGERKVRPCRTTLLGRCLTPWRVKVNRWLGRSDCLFTVTGSRVVEAGTNVGRVERPVAVTGVFRYTVAYSHSNLDDISLVMIRPLQEANGYDFAQDMHYDERKATNGQGGGGQGEGEQER